MLWYFWHFCFTFWCELKLKNVDRLLRLGGGKWVGLKVWNKCTGFPEGGYNNLFCYIALFILQTPASPESIFFHMELKENTLKISFVPYSIWQMKQKISTCCIIYCLMKEGRKGFSKAQLWKPLGLKGLENIIYTLYNLTLFYIILSYALPTLTIS